MSPGKEIRVVGLIVSVAIFLAPLLAAPAATAKTTVVHMHYANHGEAWLQWLRDREAAFEAANPDIDIEIIVSVDGTGVNQLRAMAAGDALPDVTEMALVYGAMFADEGFYLDLKPLIERDPDIDFGLFAPVTLDALTWTNGELWGLPADIYTVPAFFNIDMFAEAGLANPNELGEGWDWDALVEVGRKLSRDTDNDGVFDRKAITGLPGLWDHMDVVRKAGGMLFDRYKDPTQSRLNTPEVVGAIQWLIDLYRVHGVLEDGWFGVAQGTAAVGLTSGPSAVRSLNEAGIRFDVALQPRGPVSRASYTVTNSFQIIRTSQRAAEAWRWIKFLATEPESMERFAAITGRLPALLPVAQRYGEFVINPPEHINLILQTVLDPASYHLPIGARANEARSILNSYRSALVSGTMDVASALEDAHRRINALLGAE